MKFSKTLQEQAAIPLFRGQWIAYRALKKLIKDITRVEAVSLDPEVYATQLWWFDATQKTSLGSIPQERISFIRFVESEINKTNQFYESQTKMIKYMLSEIQRRIEHEFVSELLLHDIDAIASDLLILERFVRQAKQLLLKITKKHDKMTRYRVNTWLLVRLENEPWWNPRFDELVIGISDAYNIAREMEAKQKGEAVGVDTRTGTQTDENFVRKNDKYFVKPEDVLLVKLVIARYLPLDIFQRTEKKYGGKSKKALNLEGNSQLNDNTVINSIYLDNTERLMYHERTGIRGIKGNIIRIRWYGSHPNPPAECWMERKTRQTTAEGEYFTIDEAVKERFRINERNVKNYMTGEWLISKKLESMLSKNRISEKDATSTRRKADSIQEEILSKNLRPALRTVVRRSAFQKGADQTLRFSLDTNLHIINESVQTDKWFRNMLQPLKLAEVVTLPYAILEVKTQAEPPEWVSQLKSSGYLIPAPNFSKFLYGSCKLWPDKVEFTPLWWERVTELEKNIPKSPPISSVHMLFPYFQIAAANTPVSGISTTPISTPMGSPFPIPSPASILATSSSGESSDAPSSSSKKQKQPAKESEIVVAPHVPHTLSKTEEETDKEWDNLRKVVEQKRQSQQQNKDVFHLPEDEISVDDRRGSRSKLRGSERDSSPLLAVSNFFKKAAGGLGWDSDAPAVKGGKGNAKQKTQEQRAAKTFFANERTLLSWLNTATFLSLAGLSMINTHTDLGRVAGVLLTFVTIAFAGYALYKYLQRLYGLKGSKGTAGLDDKYGPPILIATFCAVLLTVSIYYASTDQTFIK